MLVLLILISFANKINCMNNEIQTKNIYAHSYLDTTRAEISRIQNLITEVDTTRNDWIDDPILNEESLTYVNSIQNSSEYLQYTKEPDSQKFAQLRQSLFTTIFFKEFVSGISQLQSDYDIKRKLKVLSLVNYEIFNKH